MPERHLCPEMCPQVCSAVPHLLCAMGAGVAEALPSLEVALAIDAVAADEGTVLPVRPIPALGFTPVRDEGNGWSIHGTWGPAATLHMHGDGPRRGGQGGTEPTDTCESPALQPSHPGCLQWASALRLGSFPTNSRAQDWFQGCRALQRPCSLGEPGKAGSALPEPSAAPSRTHRSPIQPGLQWEHLPLM